MTEQQHDGNCPLCGSPVTVYPGNVGDPVYIPIAPADKLSLLVEWLEESYKIYTGLALPFSEVRNAEHQMIKQILTKAKSLQGG